MKSDDSLLYPALENLLERIPQKYELVLAATRRAKQILREQRLNPAAFTDDEMRRKPLTIALYDIAENRVDQQVLIAPDIEFDDLEPEAPDMFPDAEGFGQPLGERDALADEEPEPEPEEFEDDMDDMGDIDVFDLGGDFEDSNDSDDGEK
ncbi:DNA-directed RNA polymerase subunit omega [bacterium]|nr:DNA-directed RNA polymerase subunit omega [bacterium]